MKTFKTFFNSRIITEELDAELENMLNTPGFAISKIQHMIKTGHENIGNGSSRQYFKLKTPKKIILDGQTVQIPHGVKIARPGVLDDFHTNESFGKTQNKNETHLQYSPHAIIIPHPTKPNEYITNPKGVLAPIFKSKANGDWLEMGHVTPFTDLNGDEQYIAMHDDNYPNATHRDILKALSHFEALKQNAHHEIHPYHLAILKNHTVANGLAHLVSHTGLSGYDLHEGNWGIWTHPITGKKHPVVLDYGGSSELMGRYDTARSLHRAYTNKGLTEALDKDKQSILNDKTASRQRKYNVAAKDYSLGAIGGNRAYVQHPNDKPIILDGVSTKIKLGTKIASVKRPTDKHDYGVLQNIAETDEKFKPYYIIQHTGYSKFTHNPNGILATVLKKSKDGVYHEMLHATPLNEYIDRNNKIFEHLTKHKDYPNGIGFNELMQNISNQYNNSFKSHQVKLNDHILEHPLAKQLTHLIASTNAHPEDFSYDFNWGVWKHPVTGKEHPVIIDYGLTKQIMKDEYPNL